MKTVIEMAREAGIIHPEMVDKTLERFAELVRADERRAMMQLFTDPENQPTQHGTVTVNYMQREIADEREACAQVCDAKAMEHYKNEIEESLERCAAAIRARSNT